jgi:hypothetical protein
VTLITALERFLVDEVIIEAFAGFDSYAQRTYGAPRTVKARVVYTPKLVRNREGQEVVGSVVVYTSDDSITGDDRITLPDGTQPVVLSVNRSRTTAGDFAVTVVC